LIEIVSKELNTQIILTGTQSEKPLCDELIIRKSPDKKIKNFAGNFNLQELTALIDKCSIFISNSTGPIHIAAALGKYTIGFYPKIPACSAERWGPYTRKRAIFKPEIECSNCTREQCEELDCMNSIKVTDIFAQIEKFHQIVLTNGVSND
jgi:ADP-heptose:LPS heptosyltransferase